MKITPLVSTLTLTLVLAACASKVRLDELPPVNDRSTSTSSQEGAQSSGTSNQSVRTVEAGASQGNQPASGLLSQRSVYFDYDSYTIDAKFKAMLEAHAKHLGANRMSKIAIEGNTDESGGREYNLALGQKRANAVVQALRVLGVSEAQLDAVSFGKEKPKALGGGDAAAAENRRADVVYK